MLPKDGHGRFQVSCCQGVRQVECQEEASTLEKLHVDFLNSSSVLVLALLLASAALRVYVLLFSDAFGGVSEAERTT